MRLTDPACRTVPGSCRIRNIKMSFDFGRRCIDIHTPLLTYTSASLDIAVAPLSNQRLMAPSRHHGWLLAICEYSPGSKPCVDCSGDNYTWLACLHLTGHGRGHIILISGRRPVPFVHCMIGYLSKFTFTFRCRARALRLQNINND